MSAFPVTQPTDSLQSQSTTQSISRGERWTGRILSGIASVFFLFDGASKLFRAAIPVRVTLQLGYPDSSIAAIGAVLLVSTVLYMVRRTQFVGAILLCAYLGGAVATNVRVSAPLFNILFPVICGVLVWAGLFLRDQRLRLLLTK